MSKGKVPDNYGGLPSKYASYRNSAIVILPVPFDKTSTYMKGADRGPRAIIRASQNMELYDIETATEVYRKGIHTAGDVRSVSAQDMVKKTRLKVTGLLQEGKFVVVIGGEHSVSLGSIQAHSERFDNASILHLDAHSDRRESYEGNKYSHACVMARAREVTDNIISVGIRSMDASELKHVKEGSIFYASAIVRTKDWIKKVAKKLSQNVYVTIDLDVFDPSVMPSTGTPEPGGLGWYEVIDLLEYVAENKNIVGFDVVELCPAKHTVAPDFMAAKLIYKLLSMKFKSKSAEELKVGR